MVPSEVCPATSPLDVAHPIAMVSLATISLVDAGSRLDAALPIATVLLATISQVDAGSPLDLRFPAGAAYPVLNLLVI